MHLVVYFDYTCPYSFAAAAWLRQVEAREPDIATEWRPFVVREVNRAPGEGVPFWEQEGVIQTRTGLAFAARQAAVRQGTAADNRFRFLLQEAFHVRHMDIRQPGVLAALASEAGLDVARFEEDRRDPSLLGEVGRSHREAVERYGVFGTPTFVFPDGCAAYLKLARPPADPDAGRIFALLRELVEQHGVVQEVKLTRQEQP